VSRRNDVSLGGANDLGAFVSLVITSMAATQGSFPLGLGALEAACVGMLSLLGLAIATALLRRAARAHVLATHGAGSMAAKRQIALG